MKYMCLHNLEASENVGVIFVRRDLIDAITPPDDDCPEEGWTALYKGVWYGTTEEEAQATIDGVGL